MKTILKSILFSSGTWSLLLLLLLAANQSCTPSKANNATTVKPPAIKVSNYFGTAIPGFELADFQGNIISSESLKGKYVVIHIATTWCPFCNAEAPTLEQVYQDYHSKGVEVLIIDVKESKDLVKKLLIDRFELNFPVLFDTDGAVVAQLAPEGILPDLARDEVMLASNLLIDPDGKIMYYSLLDTNNFDAQLTEIKSILDVHL